MDKNSRIYLFFICLALLAWNPLSFYFFYSGSGIETSRILLAFVSMVFIAGIAGAVWVRMGKASDMFMNLSMTLSFSAMLFCLLVLGDRLVGKLAKVQEKRSAGLADAPNKKARYQTVEFDFTVETNSMGLRDREVQPVKDKYRILCFGDSWTMGFGVNNEDSWPKKLEKFLNNKGLPVEVLNCGQVGMYPTTYKELIQRVVPVLKPDMVLVGVLQFEDLAQEYEFNYSIPERLSTPEPVAKRIPFAIGQFLNISFENILYLKLRHQEAELTIRDAWSGDVKRMVQEGGKLEKLRFLYYEDSIQQLMESGDFNAVLVSYYLKFPERKFIFNNPGNRATIFAGKQMLDDFRGMRSTCDRLNARLVMVNLPFPDFTGHEVFRIPELDQFNIYFTLNNRVDSIYHSVAEETGISYIELTGKFKSLKDKKAYFYRYDNHPTVLGYDEIARTIADSVSQYIKL